MTTAHAVRCTGQSEGGFLCTRDKGHEGRCRGMEFMWEGTGSGPIDRQNATLDLVITKAAGSDHEVMSELNRLLLRLEVRGLVEHWKWTQGDRKLIV